MPDQRGYNLSDVPRGVQAYALPELVADVVGLLDHFEIAEARVVGHDWGALVAWSLALAYPERVARLAILNVPHPLAILSLLRSSPGQWLKSWYVGFFQLPRLPEWLLRRGRFGLMLAMLAASRRPNRFSDEELEEYRAAYARSGGLTGMLNWYRALLRYRPPLPADGRVHMPVLILWGMHDVALSARLAESSLRYCTDGRLIRYPDATHWVQHDEALAVNEALLAFLEA